MLNIAINGKFWVSTPAIRYFNGSTFIKLLLQRLINLLVTHFTGGILNYPSSKESVVKCVIDGIDRS